MREFFRGWRRKAGCVTLAMACVFMAGWMRSLVVQDFIDFHQFSETPIEDGRIAGVGTEPHSLNLLVFDHYTVTTVPTSSLSASASSNTSEPTLAEDIDSGVIVTRVPVLSATVELVPLVTIPFWLIATPLSLLSAYLILWKPRKVRTSDSNPAANK